MWLLFDTASLQIALVERSFAISSSTSSFTSHTYLPCWVMQFSSKDCRQIGFSKGVTGIQLSLGPYLINEKDFFMTRSLLSITQWKKGPQIDSDISKILYPEHCEVVLKNWPKLVRLWILKIIQENTTKIKHQYH